MLCPASEPFNPQPDLEDLPTYGPRDGFCPGNCFLNNICCYKVMFVSSNRLWNFPPDSCLPCGLWIILHRTTESVGRSKLRFSDSSGISSSIARAINSNINSNIKQSGYLSHLQNPLCGNLKADLSWEPGNLTLTVGYPWLLLCPKPSVHFSYAMVPSLILPLKNNPREYKPAFRHHCVKWKQSLYITCTSERVYTCKFQRKSPGKSLLCSSLCSWVICRMIQQCKHLAHDFWECSFLLTIIFLIRIQVVYLISININNY